MEYLWLIPTVLMIGALGWKMKLDDQHREALLVEIRSLVEDNKILTEALVRDAGKPLLFRKPKTEPSQGWYDSKSDFWKSRENTNEAS